MLNGSIYLTDNIEAVYHAPTDGSVKIIDMDEDNQLPKNNPNIIPGTCLLPPIDAKIAEADGNEQAYDAIYGEYLFAPFQQQYMGALIAFLFKGGNLLIFLPEQYTVTKDKLIQHILLNYGIKIGELDSQIPMKHDFFYDLHFIPCWLNLMYKENFLYPQDYLRMFPINARLDADQGAMMKLLDDLKPYGESLQEQMNIIIKYHKDIHQKPNLTLAIKSI